MVRVNTTFSFEPDEEVVAKGWHELGPLDLQESSARRAEAREEAKTGEKIRCSKKALRFRIAESGRPPMSSRYPAPE